MECLLTCGGGDFLALSHFISPGERKSIRKIYWATPAKELVSKFTDIIFPNIEEEEILFDDFNGEIPFFTTISHLQIFLKKRLTPELLDYSIYPIQLQMHKKLRRYYKLDEIYNKKLCDLSFGLPEKYIVVHHHSDNFRSDRDLTEEECFELVEEIERKDIYGVVINKSKDKFPIKSDHIIDMTNELNVYECIEVLKQASGFVGCSSIWSVAASKLFSENLFIKSPHIIRTGTRNFYYYPNAANVYKNLNGKIRLKYERAI